jgi:hypothetical protein
LNDYAEVKVYKQVKVMFGIGQCKDKILCDVVPIQTGHFLLGRPWQYDREVIHNGRKITYSLRKDGKIEREKG